MSGLIGLCTAADERDVMHLDQAKGVVTAFADLAHGAGATTEYQMHFGLNDLEADREKIDELVWLKKQGKFSKIMVFAAGADSAVKYLNALFHAHDISADDVMVVFTTAGSPLSIVDGVWRPDVLGLSESCVSQRDRSQLWDRGIAAVYYPGVPHNLTHRRLMHEAENARSGGYDLKVTASTVLLVVADCGEAKRIPPGFVLRAARTGDAPDIVVMSESVVKAPPIAADACATNATLDEDLLRRYVAALAAADGVASAQGYLCTEQNNRLPALLYKIKLSGQARIVVSGLLETAATILSSHSPHVTVTMHPMMTAFEHGAMTALWRGGWIDVQDENGKVTPRQAAYPGARNTATMAVAHAAMQALGLER